MQMYIDYIKERAGLDILVNENAFLTYKKQGNILYISDAYVCPFHRKCDILKNMVKELINSTQPKKVITTADSNANGVETSRKVINNLGFKYIKNVGTLEYYVMEL